MNASAKTLLKLALREDIGAGDITSRLLVPRNARGAAVILAREAGIFSGEELCRELCRQADPGLKLSFKLREGGSFEKNAVLLEMRGRIRSILAVERTLLNFLGHLCGIASRTHEFVERVKKYKVKILDTRKTTPLLREWEKAAVRAGGGHNHRMGLYDAVFVKENHRPYGALRKLRKHAGNFEIEVRDLNELAEALVLQPRVILFDNFKPADLRAAVRLAREANRKVILEASGGINLENIRAYAASGVDQISIGALTHSVKAVDLSLLVTRSPDTRAPV